MSARERYPGYDVLREQHHWDDATRKVILERVNNVPPIRFFTPEEVETLQAVADTILPQDDRPPDRRIPIVPFIDKARNQGETPGYRFEDLPDYPTAWRWGLEGIDQTSGALFGGRRFVELRPVERMEALRRIRDGNPPGEVWQRMDAPRFFTHLLVHDIVDIYYAHPWAWNEIGYGGPAYPRGYYGLSHGAREHWEVQERR